ncbi:MAG: glycerol-3-phosphate 1-O-acyltransferase PlsY [Clostridiales bacterium]|nr:glycerol-3-phosphate 1-O-acyltransferase PlsY [Clostridiales bacterium]
MIILLIFAAVLGYLLGSINSSIIVGRINGIDIRKHGSGNAGTTNALRVLGKKAAVLVLAGDLLKGVLSYLAGYYLVGLFTAPAGAGSDVGGMIAGTAAIIGHVWPVYFGFKGGKGVLTSLSVLLMMDWQTALILLGIFIIIVAITRYVSLGSVIGAALLPVFTLVLGRDAVHVVFSAIIGILLIVMHRANIKRLLEGSESKLGAKKKEQ